jgi:Fe2+ transport system protein B
VQDIDDYIINPKEITDLIDSDPSVLKEIEKLKEESKKVASEAIEKLKTSNENELRETFQKTTERVVSAQSEAESAAMDELKIQEERMRKAEENLRENEEEKRERKNRDRIESAKVGTVSAIGGVLLSLPLALSQFSGNAFNQFADVGATALSCALFGIVYRYAVRENIDDFQLKGGVVGAFGLVRGVGQAEVFMDVASNNDELSFAAFAQAAAICGESVLVFLFAGLCVEAAMTREFILRKSGKE